MSKSIINKLAALFGYEFNEIQPIAVESPGLIQYEYLRSDGSFNYDKYLKIQTKGNKEKIRNVWVIEENIAFLSNYIKNAVPSPEFGICHGVRRGKEQEWFRKHIGCEVIGTEISDTAESFPNTIQWDFHETRPEWIGEVDFIYSNSFDHSYDPEKCLNAWMSCIKKGGLCIIEHTDDHGPSGASELDPFGADIIQYPYLITTWGNGAYGVRQIVQAPKMHETVKYIYFIVIQKF